MRPWRTSTSSSVKSWWPREAVAVRSGRSTMRLTTDAPRSPGSERSDSVLEPRWASLTKGPTMHDRSLEPNQPTGNLLLDALSQYERALVLTDARTKPIKVGGVLFHPGDAVSYVPFPTSGTISMLAQPDDAGPVEAATIGLEGAGALHSALGSRMASQELVGQVDGEMIVVGIERFVKQANEGQLQSLVYGYLEALVVQISLSAACNALHHV